MTPINIGVTLSGSEGSQYQKEGKKMSAKRLKPTSKIMMGLGSITIIVLVLLFLDIFVYKHSPPVYVVLGIILIASIFILISGVMDMVKNFRDLVLRIRDSANQTASSSNNLAQISEQSAQTMTQLAGSVSQISSSTSMVAQSSQQASSASSQANQAAMQGKEAIEKLVQKMQGIQSSVEESAKGMEGLARRSTQIGEIVSVITKIADQTNLLSLNAAIEAARAGEAGKGFAVVADEVRKLAESSSKSAQQIQNIIQEVQKDTTKTVDLARQGAKDVEEGGIFTSETQKVFSEIAKTIKNITIQIDHITSAAEQTAALSEEASASSEEQTAAIQEIARSAGGLSSIAKSLQEAVQQFKV